MSLDNLVPGARFSVRVAKEHMRREAVADYQAGHPQYGDCRDHNSLWSSAAYALPEADPDGRKLAELLQENHA